VAISGRDDITLCRRFFQEPATPRQRQYEALRAFFLEGLPSAAAARRFGYKPGAFRVLCHAFRHGQLPEFFATTRPGPRPQPKKSSIREQIVALRKRNYSVYDICATLKEQGYDVAYMPVLRTSAAWFFISSMEPMSGIMISTMGCPPSATRWRAASMRARTCMA